ncbi:TRAP transporter small permease [Marinobacter sp.]|uniref:TRAP transporter small permease n=1 Tax=Marinobacter sp. TaxID=50741 RepID=UPI001B747078|nr:TRAP transporter small permease [Marinobacter sp.]MBQ0832294.1 TRAP transporter small permease [Marinobacter sp.]
MRKFMQMVDVAFTTVAVVALASLTILVVADVSLRYGIGEPLFFAHDVVILYLTPALFFFGVGPTYWRDEHLAVDLLVLQLPARSRAMTDMVGAMIGVFIFVLLIWMSWDRAWISFANGERIASIVPWPAWLSYVLVPVGSLAMILVCLARLVLATQAFITGKHPSMPEHSIHGEDAV